MKQVRNFLKGSLLAIALLAVIYSPFETEADMSSNSEVGRGVVTSGATVQTTTPIFDSLAFISHKSTSSLNEIIEPITPTPEEAVTAEPTLAAIPTKTASSSAKPKVLAANSATPTTPPERIVESPHNNSSPIPYDEHFTKYAAAFNVSKQTLVHIARCESGFRPEATNGPYLGMFQYLADTWSSTRTAMGENPDPALRSNAEEAIKTSAWKIAHGGIGSWPVCGS